ncbi:hypothetical protein FDENT_4395 [Fusarium denticulatum]|uniref:Uncharacterized protein n=1 Tax=Fusarium denticulatum TaxID=48507 RepID=A0A8H5XAL4_9HYPO|nr:hypothetical protein FDENT_4395 [Fusarium denticulatum]
MASQERDRLILREDVTRDDKVTSSRDPDTAFRNHRMLTKEEKFALIQHAREYVRVLVHQRGQASASSKKLLKKFYSEVFLHWSTSQRRNPYPTSSRREDSQTLVGSRKKTCSEEAIKGTTQNCGKPVYLSLNASEDAEFMMWTWNHSDGRSIGRDRIEFEPGLTVTRAKINAIHNYDNHERRRISSYNTQRSFVLRAVY